MQPARLAPTITTCAESDASFSSEGAVEAGLAALCGGWFDMGGKRMLSVYHRESFVWDIPCNTELSK